MNLVYDDFLTKGHTSGFLYPSVVVLGVLAVYGAYKIIPYIISNVPKISFIYNNFTELLLHKVRQLAITRLRTGLLESDHLTFKLTYYNGINKHIIVFPKKRGPCPFESVYFSSSFGASNANVTEEIRKFAGPSYNFHGVQTTPDMLGYESLRFKFRNTLEHRIFERNDIIVFP